MPIRSRHNKRRQPARVTPESVELFRQGFLNPHNKEIRSKLAAALGRSKFAANPLDHEPRSLIGGDTEPVDVALSLRAELVRRAGV